MTKWGIMLMLSNAPLNVIFQILLGYQIPRPEIEHFFFSSTIFFPGDHAILFYNEMLSNICYHLICYSQKRCREIDFCNSTLLV